MKEKILLFLKPDVTLGDPGETGGILRGNILRTLIEQ